jgi:hypothetical protein
MIEYILLVFLVTILSIFAYIKIKYPFWNNQPVYHSYDFWRFLQSTPYSIYRYRPVKTKFCDFDNIKTYHYLEITHEQIDCFKNILQCYYYSNESIIHYVQSSDILSWFTGQNEPSFISFYNEPVYAVSNGDVLESKLTVGAISSRTVMMFYRKNKKQSKYNDIPVYYIDYLTVHRDHDKKKISRKLLQTHEYNQRIKNPLVNVSLIKKEDQLFEGIVPFIKYKTYTFALRNINFPGLPKTVELVGLNNENLDILFDFIHVQKNLDFERQPCLFDVFIISDIGNLISLVNQQNLYVFCLRSQREILGVYFFKNTKTQFEASSGETLQFIGSVSNCKSNDTFYLGFLHSLKQIIKIKREFKILVFENIGHNMIVFDYWRDKHTPLFENLSAYYLFNFIFPGSTISPDRTFFVF